MMTFRRVVTERTSISGPHADREAALDWLAFIGFLVAAVALLASTAEETKGA